MAEEYLDQSPHLLTTQPSRKIEKGDLLQVESSNSPCLCFGNRDVDSVIIDALDHEEQSKEQSKGVENSL